LSIDETLAGEDRKTAPHESFGISQRQKGFSEEEINFIKGMTVNSDSA